MTIASKQLILVNQKRNNSLYKKNHIFRPVGEKNMVLFCWFLCNCTYFISVYIIPYNLNSSPLELLQWVDTVHFDLIRYRRPLLVQQL